MKLTQKPNIKRNAGMTLIELTVVILVLLALIAVLFIGAKAYKKGADKAACVMNQRNIQQAYRSYYNLNPTGTLTAALLYGADAYIGSAPVCPSEREAYIVAYAADAAVGTIVAPCPTYPSEGAAAGDEIHEAADTGTW